MAEPIPLAVPSPKQLEFASWEVGAFFHYNLNPFTGQEHGDGQEPPSKFNPTKLNVDQWLDAAKKLGARYAVLTARHEGGFCLWPTKTTKYSIANSPYQDGKGDLVRDFITSCRKHGLKVGLYHTAGFDAHEALRDFPVKEHFELPLTWGGTWGQAIGMAMRAGGAEKREAFKKIQVAQMTELLTQYGKIDFMWSDHWNAKNPDGVWRAVTDLAAKLQPEMVFMGTDTWVPGNETGHVVYPMWNAVNTEDGTIYSRPAATSSDANIANDYGLLETGVRAGHPLGKFWRVREATTNTGFHHGGWFWHPDDVLKTAPLSTGEQVDLYYRTVGLGANTIINLPIDTRGVVPEEFVQAAEAFGKEITNRFFQPIAETSGLEKGKVIELSWERPQKINTIVTMENIATGQKVAKYRLQAEVDDKWIDLEPRNKLIAWEPYDNFPKFETIGHKKIDRVGAVVTRKVRFECLEAIAPEVELAKIAVYHCKPIPRNYKAAFPYLSGIDTIQESAHRGVKRDINYHGEGIRLGGKAYEHGLLVCPSATKKEGFVQFDLAELPPVTGMTAVIGIEDMTGNNGSCVFLVETATDGGWEEFYRSPKLTGKSKPVPLELTFPAGTKKLRLRTTYAGDSTSSDHAMWADAKLVQE